LKRFILFLSIIIFFVNCGKPEAPKSSNNIEKKQTEQTTLNIAPNFTLLDLDGNKHTLSDYKGNVVIIDFWATFCPPCRIEIPHFIEFYDEYKDRGLVILGVGLDGEEKLRSFRDAMRINYPILVGDRAVAISYDVQAIPVTFIINSEGEIIKKILGYAPGYEDTIKQSFLPLLEIDELQ
jgi:cytochrome c biogenesis protein CcmG/thiol:disulfide interchange protein DsbE